MARIRQLSENMIGKIAAGEVVERPAAAIKELVENSLDAGSTAVTVEIREGGMEAIRVSDNGSGIDESDIRMAFERHATSKVSKEQDLFSIKTLGFRGEALASIAAVSRVTMTTRTADRETGLRVKNEGGALAGVTETACPVGTTMAVKDLFYNVPVRKGFMKKAGQEASAVGDLMSQLILSRPDVSFRYIVNGKTEFHSPGDGKLLSALVTVYGIRAAKEMREVDGHGSGLLVRGYVGIGENARGNRNHELFFINGRVMHSRLLNEAVERACRERVMIGKFPACALHITIPYEAVDVNVHPNKLEVRFRDENAVQDAVFTAVLEALRDKDAFEHPVEMHLTKPAASAESAPTAPVRPPQRIAEVTTAKMLPREADVEDNKEKPVPELREAVRPFTGSAPQPVPPPHIPAPMMDDATAQTVFSQQITPQTQPRELLPDLPPLKEGKAEQVNTILPQMPKPMKVFGALFNTFILVEYEDRLLLVDQHAVHERLLFDRLMREHAEGPLASQELLVPVVAGVTKQEMRLLEDNRESLESIGLFVESFGERDAAIRSLPMILGETQARDFLTDVIAELGTGKDTAFERKRAALLQTACKHAVKGGEALSEDQLRSLLDTMIEQKVTPTCPHGRPLVVTITHRELDRKFKRIQQ